MASGPSITQGHDSQTHPACYWTVSENTQLLTCCRAVIINWRLVGWIRPIEPSSLAHYWIPKQISINIVRHKRDCVSGPQGVCPDKIWTKKYSWWRLCKCCTHIFHWAAYKKYDRTLNLWFSNSLEHLHIRVRIEQKLIALTVGIVTVVLEYLPTVFGGCFFYTTIFPVPVTCSQIFFFFSHFLQFWPLGKQNTVYDCVKPVFLSFRQQFKPEGYSTYGRFSSLLHVVEMYQLFWKLLFCCVWVIDCIMHVCVMQCQTLSSRVFNNSSEKETANYEFFQRSKDLRMLHHWERYGEMGEVGGGERCQSKCQESPLIMQVVYQWRSFRELFLSPHTDNDLITLWKKKANICNTWIKPGVLSEPTYIFFILPSRQSVGWIYCLLPVKGFPVMSLSAGWAHRPTLLLIWPVWRK